MSNTTFIIKGEVMIYVTDAKAIAQEAIDRHKTLPLASLALATSIAVLGTFGSYKKGIHTSVNVKGNGPLKNIIVETNGNGKLRALIGNPFVKTDADEKNFNNIPLTVGIGDGGSLKIVHTNEKINFGGEVPLANGDITTDLAYYLDQSEQINSAVISSIILDSPQKLEHARAVIFVMLPKHSEKDIRWLENFIKNNSLENLSLVDYIKNINGKILETMNLKWQCTCNKNKMLKVAKTLPQNDQKELIQKYGYVEIICNFCKNKYQFTTLDKLVS